MWPRAVLRVALRGPGTVLLLASAAGWIVMVWLLTGDRLPYSADTMRHGEHVAASTATRLLNASGHFTAMWLAMILAMAPPLLLREIGRLWRTSLHRLRHVTVAWFVCGYVGLWLLVGVALMVLSVCVTVSSERIAAAVALVALWHCSPARQRCLNACHKVPTLRVFGRAAHWDSLRYGVSTGWYCAGTCGLAMLLVLLATDRHLVGMALVAVVATVERYLPARRPGWRLPLVRGRSPEWPSMPVAIRSVGVGWW
jgi:predicted metal-binding membrane protein